MKNYTILIPCHEDCIKARTLKNKLNSYTNAEIIIGHNGCSNSFTEGIDWANKAKTINHYARKIKTKYLIVIDADVYLTDNTILGFENAMNDGILGGTALSVFVNKGKITNIQHKPEWCGAAWFSSKEILLRYPVPEDILTEDTAFHMVLKRNHIMFKVIPSSTVMVEQFEHSFSKKFKQAIRYHIGALQLSKAKLSNQDAISLYLVIFTNAVLLIILFKMWWISLIGYISLLITAWGKMVEESQSYKMNPQWIIYFLSLTIIPFMSLYYFYTNKRIW